MFHILDLFNSVSKSFFSINIFIGVKIFISLFNSAHNSNISVLVCNKSSGNSGGIFVAQSIIMDMVESGFDFLSEFFEFSGHGFESVFFFFIGSFKFFNSGDQCVSFSLSFDDVINFVLGKSDIDEFIVSLGEGI